MTYPNFPTHTHLDTLPLVFTTYPIDDSLYKESISISVSHKLGSFAGRSISYLKSKQGKRRVLQSYILSEALITLISIASLLYAGMYIPATLLTIMFAYLIYAALDIL